MYKNKYFEELIKLPSESAKALPTGVIKAGIAYRHSMEYQTKFLEMKDILWDDEIVDFISTLHKANIGPFYVTDQSTALMRELHAFVKCGCMIGLLATVVRHDPYSGRTEEVPGITILL